MHNTTFALALSLLCLPGGLAAAAPPGAEAQDPGTLTVTGEGQTVTLPTRLALATEVRAYADTAEQAFRDFAQIRKRAEQGLQATGPDGLELLGQGEQLDFGKEQQGGGTGMAGMMVAREVIVFDTMGTPETEKPEGGLNISETLELYFPVSADLAERRATAAHAIDSAVDLGLSPSAPSAIEGGNWMGADMVFAARVSSSSRGTGSSSGIVQGRLSPGEREAAEKAAQAAAMERARQLAQGLAELSGRKLGGVQSLMQVSLGSTWKGLGIGVETRCSLQVTFTLE